MGFRSGSLPVARDQPVGKGGQVVVNTRAGWKGGGQGTAPVHRAVAGQHQMRFAACGGTGHHVASGITHDRYRLEVNAVALAYLVKEAWFGLAAMAFVVRRVRAIKNGIDATADGWSFMSQFSL